MKFDALQTALYQKLIGDAALMALLSGAWGIPAVFSDVPEGEGEDAALFPYVSFGPDLGLPFDDKDETGGDHRLQVNVWSRSGDYIEAKGIGGKVIDALHRQSLSISGATHVLTEFISADFTKDPDGKTRRGLLFFNVIYND